MGHLFQYRWLIHQKRVKTTHHKGVGCPWERRFLDCDDTIVRPGNKGGVTSLRRAGTCDNSHSESVCSGGPLYRSNLEVAWSEDEMKPGEARLESSRKGASLVRRAEHYRSSEAVIGVVGFHESPQYDSTEGVGDEA
jgi:hypothetical protein